MPTRVLDNRKLWHFCNFVVSWVSWDICYFSAQLSLKQSTAVNKVEKKSLKQKHSPQCKNRKKVHLYLWAVFVPKKSYISLSILENVPAPLLPSPRKALLPVTTLQCVRILSLFFNFLINQVSRAFSLPSFPPSSSLSCLKIFFLSGCSCGLRRVVGQRAG